MVNSEETLKMRNVSIRLVDIAKRCKKGETSIKLDKIFIGKDAQNQLHIYKNSAKETIRNNKKVSDYYETSKIIL